MQCILSIMPPIKYTEKVLRFRGKKIQTYTFGSGKNIILAMPSYPHSGLIFTIFWLFAQKMDAKFITFDMPGWIGKSENVFKGWQYDMATIIEIVDQIIKSYKVKNFSLLGYSFGTATATCVAAKYRERVKKIALVSPVINGKIIKKKLAGGGCCTCAKTPRPYSFRCIC